MNISRIGIRGILLLACILAVGAVAAATATNDGAALPETRLPVVEVTPADAALAQRPAMPHLRAIVRLPEVRARVPVKTWSMTAADIGITRHDWRPGWSTLYPLRERVAEWLFPHRPRLEALIAGAW